MDNKETPRGWGSKPYSNRESVLLSSVGMAVSKREKEFIRKKAKEAGMSMSRYLRGFCKDTLLEDTDNEERRRVD